MGRLSSLLRAVSGEQSLLSSLGRWFVQVSSSLDDLSAAVPSLDSAVAALQAAVAALQASLASLSWGSALSTFTNTGDTTGAAQTTIASFTPTNEGILIVTAVVEGQKTSDNTTGLYTRAAGFKVVAGTVTKVGATSLNGSWEDDITWGDTLSPRNPADIDTDGTEIRVRVSGKAATTISWSVYGQAVSYGV